MPDTGSAISFPVATPPDPGTEVEIADGVLWIRLPLPMALDHVNVYALDDGESWTLVDTGVNTSACRRAWNAILAGPLADKPVRRVFLTHHHPDHVGCAGTFAENGAALYASRVGYLTARMLTLDVQDRPLPETLSFWRAAGMDEALVLRRAAERPFNFSDIVAPIPLGFTRLDAGDVISAGGRTWDIRVGHGHAPDHLTFWSRDDNLVIGGDQFLPSISPNLGVYATEPYADTVGDWLRSCRAFEAFARSDQLVLPGHKLPFTGLPERLRHKIDNHVQALDRLRGHLDRPYSAAQCFVPIFGREIGADDTAYGLALGEAVGHLNHLLALGEVSRESRDGVWVWRRV
ncbi:MAG: MBL fold metallo-hydrolase [Pseudomonadota bacterium]